MNAERLRELYAQLVPIADELGLAATEEPLLEQAATAAAELCGYLLASRNRIQFMRASEE